MLKNTFRTLLLAATSACVLFASESARAEEKKLNLFIWSEYIDPEIVKSFEKEFHCKVNIDLYEDNESMMAKLQAGGDSLYDVVVPSDYAVQALVKRGLLAPLRHENIPNFKNVDPAFLKPTYDPENKYTAPYQWGTVGIFIRKTDKPVEPTWGLFFDEKKQPGTFVLIDSMRENFDAGLKYLGYGLNTTDPEVLKKVRDLLLNAKARSLGFESGVGGKNKVLAKGCTMAIVYSGDAARAMAQDANTQYIIPKEGGEIWVDNMAVPSKAPHRELAEKFINYILNAKVGAQLSNFNQYATPNAAAKKLVNPDDLKNPVIYPPKEVMGKLEFLQDLGEKTQLLDELWTQVKSK